MKGFACPRCGGPTEVLETRGNVSGLRRRRSCENPLCTGKLTTQEVIVLGGVNRFDGDHQVVPRLLINRMLALSEDLAKLQPRRDGHPEDEVSC